MSSSNPAGAPSGAPALFSNVDATGRFVRDTAVSGVLHRGVSYREAQANESLHLSVDGNFVSAHVDRYSPLNHRRDGRFRYSLAGLMAHWVEDLIARRLRHVLGRDPIKHCQLACEVVWVPDDDAGAGDHLVDLGEGSLSERDVEEPGSDVGCCPGPIGGPGRVIQTLE